MKKLLAMSMAAMMMMGMATTGIRAAGTEDVDTNQPTSNPEGEVYGSISKDALKQMKFTVPIRIDFAVVKGGTDTPANTVAIGDYKIVVPNDSGSDVKLTNVNVKRANGSEWDLKSSSEISSSKNLHDIALKINGTKAEGSKEITGGTDLNYYDNIMDVEIKKNTSKSLNITGTHAPVEITKSEEAKLAFNIIYTIEQVKETPAVQ